jgi:hypothetical protein
LIEALKPLRVHLPEGALCMKPGEPADLEERYARKLLAKVPDKVRLAAPAGEVWPTVCLESERKFGTYEARLYPLLHRMVWTPFGPGRLVQVFAGRTAVILEDDIQRLHFLDPEAVQPVESKDIKTAVDSRIVR